MELLNLHKNLLGEIIEYLHLKEKMDVRRRLRNKKLFEIVKEELYEVANGEFYEHILTNPIFSELKFIFMKLLYKGSDQAFSCRRFHELCDKKGPTVTIIKSRKGKLFGGFTPIPWESLNGQWTEDKELKTFLFSITHSTKHKLLYANRATYHLNLWGPYFGSGHDIYITDGCDNTTENQAQLKYNYDISNLSSGDKANVASYLAGEPNFSVLEYEVYLIE
jgi:hypothetical protein